MGTGRLRVHDGDVRVPAASTIRDFQQWTIRINEEDARQPIEVVAQEVERTPGARAQLDPDGVRLDEQVVDELLPAVQDTVAKLVVVGPLESAGDRARLQHEPPCGQSDRRTQPW